MKSLRKYLALSPAGRAIVLDSLTLLPWVALLLRTRGMTYTRAWLARRGACSVGDAATLTPREIAALVDASAALLRIRCLPRSLVLIHLLRDRSGSAEVRFGVARLAEGGLSAHAWVELDGLPLNDSLDVFVKYAVLPPIPRRRAGRLFRAQPL